MYVYVYMMYSQVPLDERDIETLQARNKHQEKLHIKENPQVHILKRECLVDRKSSPRSRDLADIVNCTPESDF